MVSQYSPQEDDDDASTQATQPYLDPRRLGEKNSELSGADVENVLCILHPSSPAAFRAVRLASQTAPQHVLQHKNKGPAAYQELFGTEEQETFILGVDDEQDAPPMDLALRFSSSVISPVLGFCFGRNTKSCDIVFDVDSAKRISNLHFRIFLNNHGVVMLEDLSTNGTLVDGNLLKGKGATGPAMRMLVPGSIIHILSPKEDELIKFIVHIPTREGHMEAYTKNFQTYLQQQYSLEEEHNAALHGQGKNGNPRKLPPIAVPNVGVTPSGGPVWAPLMTSSYTYGMKWDGGKEYNVTGLLGKGGFATVYRLATAMDGTPYAAKELEKGRLVKEGKLDQKIDNEMRIMKTLQHPNIVRYIDYKDVDNHLYIIMEYVPCGDLAGYLNKHGVLPEPEAKLMASQTLDALAYLHHKKITHRDIKPDNILIANEHPFSVKLSDFGLSKVVTDNQTFLKTFCGTLLYCAPEVFPHYTNRDGSNQSRKRRRAEVPKAGKQKFHSYSSSVDVWSFAAVLWYALVGKPPFEGVVDQTGRGMFEKIMSTHLDPTPLLAKGISAQAVDLLLKMLNTDPALRPTERECLQHPWLASVPDSNERYCDSILDDIEEEDEGFGLSDEEAEGALSQLSIRDRILADEDDEVPDWDPADFESSDPRILKRSRVDLLMPEDNPHGRVRADSYALPVALPSGEQLARYTPQDNASGPRLFGEIGHSALQSSGLLGQHTDEALEMRNSKARQNPRSFGKDGANDDSINGSLDKTLRASSENDTVLKTKLSGQGTSLSGAESMMREINMDSPTSANSPVNEPRTPRDNESSDTSRSAVQASEEVTPKAVTELFRREINLPGPPSFLDDGEGYSSLYQSNASAHSSADHLNAESNNGDVPEHDKSVSTIQHEHLYAMSEKESSDHTVGDALNSVFLKPAQVFGKLSLIRNTCIAVAPHAVIRLDQRTTSWGRGPQNTHVYASEDSLNIPRLGFAVMFQGHGVDEADKAGLDFTKCSGLHTIVTTGTSRGILVNGIKITKVKDIIEFGKLHTGDEITIPLEEGGEATWVVELYVGEGEKVRTSAFKKRSQKT